MEKLISIEIIANDHRFVADAGIVKYYSTKKVLYTNIPRTMDGSPVPLSPKIRYSLVFTNTDSILFFRAQFSSITLLNDTPCYLFEIFDYKFVPNLRKEQRKAVNFQAVASDFNRITVVTILDISVSGAKIVSGEEIISEFVELFFDQSNNEKSVSAQIQWKKYSPEDELYFYGVDFITQKR